MFKKSIFIVFVLCSFFTKAQDSSKVTLSGTIKDNETGEALIGATIVAKSGVGTVADLDGNFKLKLTKGDYNIEISMLGYKKYSQKIKLNINKSIEVKLESDILDEVEVVANIAQIRETPVAFSSISATKIQEELGGKDISMIANTTPGAYASSQGGGAGDSRVTIRGQDQTNIGVLVDGIPVNDMESGAVFWSNWDGLKDITRSMQIQRGLGASKLAIASVGGTMNFITNGIEGKKQMVVKKEWGNNNANVMSLAYNSGLINGKWGFTLAGSYRSGDGWAQQTWYNAYSYFVKIQFMPNPRHIISIGVNGAPQSHGQRSTKMQIAVYDRALASELGVNTDSVLHSMSGPGSIKYTTLTQGNRDLRWNPDQALLNGGTFNDKTNFFHKPLFNLSHFWKISDKTTLSTVAYASIGKGGGTLYTPSLTGRDSITGYIILQPTYNSNSTFTTSAYPTEHKSGTILYAKNNDHSWLGVLSTATTKLSKLITLTYGVDLRYYEGYHYYSVYNLIGGDYFNEAGNFKNLNLDPTNPNNFKKKKGDIFGSNYTGKVRWAGLFVQGEFKKDKWSGFFTATGSYSGYNRIDYYKKKDLVLSDTTYNNYVGFNTTVVHNGVTYDRNSAELRTATTGWKYQIGYTIKGGANYNLTEHQNVFVNVGIMQIPLKFSSVFNFSNQLIKGFKPQQVRSYEIGYGLKYNKCLANINAYYTTLSNQPQPSLSDANGNVYIINGVDLIYKGLEFEATYRPIKQIEFDGVVSFGDWVYNSGGTVYSYDPSNTLIDSIQYSAKGVHVGNAAQTQLSLGVRFMPIKGFYIKPRFTRFDKNYANFNTIELSGANANRESWKMPGYNIIDISAGYEIPFSVFKVNIYGTVNNILNTRYINDGQNNQPGLPATFNATSAGVFFGVGRTFTFGTKLTF